METSRQRGPRGASSHIWPQPEGSVRNYPTWKRAQHKRLTQCLESSLAPSTRALVLSCIPGGKEQRTKQNQVRLDQTYPVSLPRSLLWLYRNLLIATYRTRSNLSGRLLRWWQIHLSHFLSHLLGKTTSVIQGYYCCNKGHTDIIKNRNLIWGSRKSRRCQNLKCGQLHYSEFVSF